MNFSIKNLFSNSSLLIIIILDRSGDVSMTIALKTVNYLDKEKEFIPWKASLGELGYVDSMLERTALYGPFSVRNYRISGNIRDDLIFDLFVITLTLQNNLIHENYIRYFSLIIRNFLNCQKKWLKKIKRNVSIHIFPVFANFMTHEPDVRVISFNFVVCYIFISHRCLSMSKRKFFFLIRWFFNEIY